MEAQSTFAQELKQANNKPEVKLPQGAAPLVPDGPADIVIEDKASNVEVPSVTAQGSEAVTKGTEGGETKIRIGDKEFSTQDQALQYAKELIAQGEGYDKGVADVIASVKPAVDVPQVDPVKAFMKKIGDKLFENPEEALTEFAAHLSTAAVKQVDAKQERENSQKQMWESFFQKNQDLGDFQDFVKAHTMNRLNVYGDLAPETALQKIAGEVRGMLKLREDVNKPKTTLTQASTLTTPVTNGGSVSTGKVEEEQPLDFSSAVRKHGRRELKKTHAA